MKLFLVTALCLLSGLLPAQLQAEMRTFISGNGQAMKAELVSHSNGKVTIKREDGQEFEVDPAIFCKEDQQFIEKWMKTKPEMVRYDLEIGAAKKVADRDKYGSSSSYTKWIHEISVRNDGQDDVKGIKILYRVLYASSGSERMLEGEHLLAQALEFNRTLVITTDTISIYRSKYSRDSSIRGCLVRVLDSNGNVIEDWVSADVGMKDKNWSNTEPRVPGEEKPKVEIR